MTGNQPRQLVWLNPDESIRERGPETALMQRYAVHPQPRGRLISAVQYQKEQERVLQSRASATLTPRTVKAGQVSEVARQRVESDTDYLASCGFTPRATIYAPGSVVNSWGVGNFAVSRQAWEDQPKIEAVLSEVRDRVASEDRRDVVADAEELRLHVRGGGELLLTRRRGGGAINVERHGLKKMISTIKSVLPSWGHTQTMDAEHIADHFNRRIQQYGAGQRVKLRTRSLDGAPRSLFATVGPKYGVHDADEVAQALIWALGNQGLRGTAIYNPNNVSLTVDASYHADKVVDLAAGDVFKVGLYLTAKDDGTGSIRGGDSYLRNLCLNLLILDNAKETRFRIVHRGDMRKSVQRIRASMSGSLDRWAVFAERWGALRSTPIEVDGDNAADVFERWVALDDALRGAAPGVKNDALVEALLSGWNATQAEDPTRSTFDAADLVNSVTRIHEAQVPVRVREGLETYAGSLLDGGSIGRLVEAMEPAQA